MNIRDTKRNCKKKTRFLFIEHVILPIEIFIQTTMEDEINANQFEIINTCVTNSKFVSMKNKQSTNNSFDTLFNSLNDPI